jgi:hypothetical protein
MAADAGACGHPSRRRAKGAAPQDEVACAELLADKIL